MGASDSRPVFLGSLKRIRSEPIPDDDTQVFDTLFSSLTDDVSALWSLLQPDDVRFMLRFQPRSLCKVVLIAIRKLHAFVKTSDQNDESKPEDKHLALNCVRVLTRILPVLFESPGHPVVHNLFWANQLPPHTQPTQTQLAKEGRVPMPGGYDLAPQSDEPVLPRSFSLSTGASGASVPGTAAATADRADGETKSSSPSTSPIPADVDLPPATMIVSSSGFPLGRDLIHTIMSLLFCPGFTVGVPQYKEWKVQLAEHVASLERARTPPRVDRSQDVRSPASRSDVASRATGRDGQDEDGSVAETDEDPGSQEDDSSDDYDDEDDSGSSDEESGIRALAPHQNPLTSTVWSLLMWAPGVGFPDITPTQSPALNANRADVLRLLITCLSEPLYVSPNPLEPYRSRFLDTAVSATCPYAPSLFYCLLNTALSYDPIGWGVPYASALLADTDEPVADLSLQALTILLDYAPLVPEVVHSAATAFSPETVSPSTARSPVQTVPEASPSPASRRTTSPPTEAVASPATEHTASPAAPSPQAEATPPAAPSSPARNLPVNPNVGPHRPRVPGRIVSRKPNAALAGQQAADRGISDSGAAGGGAGAGDGAGGGAGGAGVGGGAEEGVPPSPVREAKDDVDNHDAEGEGEGEIVTETEGVDGRGSPVDEPEAPPSPPSDDEESDVPQTPPRQAPAAPAAPTGQPPQRLAIFNFYRSMLHSLREPSDFTFVFKAISRLLNTVLTADGTYLPYSYKQVSSYQEMLVLFWKFIDENPAFLDYVLRKENVMEIITPMLYFMWSGRLQPAKVGLVHICTFIILLLSGERNFAVALNRPFTRKLPADLPLFTGSHLDLLVIVLHKLVVNGSNKLATLYNCFLTIIANASPYAKSLSMVASVKLMNLFEMFSAAKFLFARADHHALATQLIDTFNNIVQYQFEGNTHVVYSLVRRGHLIRALADLDVPAVPPHASLSPTSAASSHYTEGTGVTSPDSRQSVDTGHDHDDDTASEDESDEEDGSPGYSRESKRDSAAPAGGAPDRQRDSEARAPDTARPAVPAFRPTKEWLYSWKRHLKLGTLLRLIDFLSPQVDEFVSKTETAPDEDAVIAFLKQVTMVGLLPVPHPIITRRYQPNQYTSLWFTTFLWGVVFLRNQEVPLFDSTKIKLFAVSLVG